MFDSLVGLEKIISYKKNILDFSHFPLMFIGQIAYSLIPKIKPEHLCEAWKLCSVRERSGVYLVVVKHSNGDIEEIPLADVVDADTYLDKPIIRSYASGCVFISEDKQQVFLVTTEKKGKIQHQFTGGSPLEEEFKDIITKSAEGKIRVDLWKIEDNAVERTKKRTGAEPIEFYNQRPFVDRILQETTDENGNTYRRLVLLLHFAVKTYEGNLGFQAGVEEVVDGKWYNIEEIPTTSNMAANAYLVSKKALEILR